MFDAKSLLDGLLGGAQRAGQPGGAQGAGLGGLLGQVMTEIQTRARQSGLDDIPGKIREKGGAGAIAGSVFNQATGGVRDAARQVDQRTGASDALSTIVGQLSGGKAPGELVAQVKDLIAKNPTAATAALGGLAAAIFGTSTGRGLATGAAKLGGLAMIGGLAWSAWQNHQQGKPLFDVNSPAKLLPPPNGSGFDPAAATNSHAELFIRAMIAASAADGTVDAAERAAIIGGVKQAGFDGAANQWLENEIANPASVDDLVAGAAGSPQLAAQVYTAARIAIEPDDGEESDFLRELATGLGLDAQLVAQIDAAATSAQAQGA